MTNQDEVLIEELSGKQGAIGILTLNRPQALNSLNESLVHTLYEQLKKWETNASIKAVVIKSSSSRAFCAGGDLRQTAERMQERAWDALSGFFRHEYQLNKCIFHYPKPYIALLDGITMGGGVGISIHGSHRVGTDKLVFAMPETSIGFFPDVGGTYFLPRLPNRIGYYLGLTGARINSDDCLALGITHAKVASENLPQLILDLAAKDFGAHPNQAVSEVIDTWQIEAQRSSLGTQVSTLEHCFHYATMEEIIANLQKVNNDFPNSILDSFAVKSPTSLKVSLRAMQLGEQLAFDDCMEQEYRLTNRFIRSHDFYEGIRAVIIDKDQKPKWLPATLAEVTEPEIDCYLNA